MRSRCTQPSDKPPSFSYINHFPSHSHSSVPTIIIIIIISLLCDTEILDSALLTVDCTVDLH